jgi:hypothetical protein
LPDNWREILRAEAAAEKYTALGAQLSHLDAIPLSIKTATTMYIAARHMEQLRAIAKQEEKPIQELLREGVEHVLDKRLKKPTTKKPASKKRAAKLKT